MSSARYVYAIVRRDAPLPTTIGVGADELAMVPWRELAAVARPAFTDSVHLTMDAVLHHERIVEAVREQGPALPVRFGTVFQSESTLTSALAERYAPLVADLDRLGDKSELSLTALWNARGGMRDERSGESRATSTSSNSPLSARAEGASYLRARAAELQRDEALEQEARTLAAKIDEVLGRLAIERRVSLVPTPRIAIRTSYLIAPGGAAAFRAAFDVVRREHGELRMLLTGPWPPYRFAAPPETQALASTDRRVVQLAQLFTDAMQDRRD